MYQLNWELGEPSVAKSTHWIHPDKLMKVLKFRSCNFSPVWRVLGIRMTPITQRLILSVLASLCCVAGFAQGADGRIEFKKRADSVLQLVRADPLDWTLAEAGAEALLRDFPRKFDGYLDMMVLTWNAELVGKLDLERKLATEMAILAGPDPAETPDWAGTPVGWAKGVIHRLDLEGQSVELQFTDIDGQKVDLAAMKGKVVLIDFWATWCPPCRASLPSVKATLENYRARGLRVVSISWDNDQPTLEKFVTANGISWPQHFEGARRKFGEEFGIGGIPYMLLIDKQGRLRSSSAYFDDPKFVDQIPKLLAE
jgi:thiol-disulfide isomerase/thioredoxin